MTRRQVLILCILTLTILPACICGQGTTPPEIGQPTTVASPMTPSEPPTTSAPIDTPVSTDTSPPPQIIGIGQRAEKAGIALTINGLRREPELSEFMKADEGNVFLIVDLTIENAGRDESTPYNPLYCKVKSADGFEYTSSVFGTDKGLKSGELEKGEIARGEVAFEVPTEASGFIFSYEPLVLFGGYEPIKVRLE